MISCQKTNKDNGCSICELKNPKNESWESIVKSLKEDILERIKIDNLDHPQYPKRESYFKLNIDKLLDKFDKEIKDAICYKVKNIKEHQKKLTNSIIDARINDLTNILSNLRKITSREMLDIRIGLIEEIKQLSEQRK